MQTAAERIRAWSSAATLALLLIAPACAGAKPPWAWGFLLAGVSLLGAAVLLAEFISPLSQRILPPLLGRRCGLFIWPAVGVLAWISGRWLLEAWEPGQAGLHPTPAASPLLFAWAFAAAFLAGFAWGGRSSRLHKLFAWVFAATVLYACWCLASWAAHWPAEYLHWPADPRRPAGPFVNANRFAVYLSMGLFAGLALASVRFSLGSRRPETGAAPLGFDWAMVGHLCGAALIFVALCATLSRLTILVVGVALGVCVTLWALHRKRLRVAGLRRPEARPSLRRTPRRLLAAVALFVVLVLASLAAAHTVGRRDLASRVQNLSREMEPDAAGRAMALRVGWDLAVMRPWTGWGPGSLESAFRLRQPAGPTERWCEVHNDWLQVAIELGWPALAALLVSVCAWFAFWWRAVRSARRPFLRYAWTAGGMLIAVPLVCSLADFPLREPVVGLLFFLILGALSANMARRVVPVPGQLAGGVAAAVSGVLIPALLLGGAGALTIGRATAGSPWLGWIYPPPPEAGQAADYMAAARRARGYKPLQLACAAALARQLPSPEDQAAAALLLEETLQRVERADPNEYLVPLYRAFALSAQGKDEQAAEAIERAVALAPGYFDVRECAIKMHLRCVCGEAGREPSARRRHIESTQAHMRKMLEVNPALETQFVRTLEQAGLRPDEVASLWPGSDRRWLWPRARYWARLREWQRLEHELADAPPECAREPWHGVFLGRCLLNNGSAEAAMQAWTRSLRDAQGELGTELAAWFARELPRLSPEFVAEWVRRDVELLARDGFLALQLARRLDQGRQWVLADRLLGLSVQRQPNLSALRLRAELAKRLSDNTEALARARLAWELSDKSPEWERWLRTFEERKP
jgi:hypothetical protein